MNDMNDTTMPRRARRRQGAGTAATDPVVRLRPATQAQQLIPLAHLTSGQFQAVRRCDRVERHELQMNLPKGWLPDDPEAELWHGVREIIPGIDSIRLTLPGGIAFELSGPLLPVIPLPTPHPSGSTLLDDDKETLR